MNPAPKASTPHDDWFGQPRGLTILFMTETWTQFSFYGMRALLVLYMVKARHFEQQRASWIYGTYAAAVYFTPILGGIVADKWLGRRNAVIVGAAIMAVGHFAMAWDRLLFIALGTIAIGNGLFLPSLPSQIASLYDPEDERRKSAYIVYYVGVNLGAFAAPLLVGTVGELYGFHIGFVLAGIGMLLALVIYLAGARYLPSDKKVQDRDAAVRVRSASFRDQFLLLAAVAGAVVVFRGGYEQLGNTLPLWLDADVDRNLSEAFSIPVTWFLALNSLMVFALTPLLIRLWGELGRRRLEPGSIEKMACGAALVALAYLLLVFCSRDPVHRIGWPWAGGFIMLMTFGELWILPVGLGLFGRLAPSGLTATVIALWFSAGFLGNLLAAWVGTLWSELLPSDFFAVVAGVTGVAALLLAMLRRFGARIDA